MEKIPLTQIAIYELFCEGWPIAKLCEVFEVGSDYIADCIRKSIHRERKARGGAKT